jgi:hypothetical protein
MRALVLVVACTLSFVAPRTTCATGSSGHIAGTYDILICNGTCSFDKQTNAILKGRVVMFANNLQEADLRRFDENRLRHHHGEAINGCFALENVGKPSSDVGIEKIGLTSWSEQGGQYRFSLFHSPDAGYAVSVQRTKTGLAGTGSSWGVGVAAPEHPSTEIVIARRTSGASISHCTFQTAEEHEFRRLLADPARSDMFAIEDAYSQKLLSELQASTSARDWAMAGWMQRSETGEAQILRAREAAPNDPLIRWMIAVRTHANAVAVVEKGLPPGFTLQYRELYSSALAELQRVEPGNAIWWLMSLRNAVDHSDLIAADAALAHLASSEYYDDHAAELLKAQLALYQSHPLPEEYFAAVARLDRGWRLNGEFTNDTAPYYENHYPWAEIGIKNLFYMDVESGMNELFVLCVQRPDRSTARKDACVKSGRLLAARARRASVREAASTLLSEINDFVNDDVRRARIEQWMGLQFYEIIHPANADSQLALVRAEIAFINDWIESSDELDAMQRAVVRGGKPLQPPEDFRLNEASYGNFERARANGHAQTE